MSYRPRFLLFLGMSIAAARGPAVVARAEEKAAPSADATVSASPAATAEKYRLAYKFHPNQLAHYEVSQETEIVTHVKEETETARNSSKAKRHFRVTVVNENTGEADLELSIDWVHMLASFDNPARTKSQPVEFQSDDPAKHPKQFIDILESVGKPRAVIRFSPTGKIVKVVRGVLPPAPAAANQLAQGPAAPPAADGSPESFFLPLPEHPVAVGEAWKDRFDVYVRDDQKNLVKITIQKSYKLSEIKTGKAIIDFRTAILTPVPDPAVAKHLIQRELSGKVVFDLDRGLIVSRESGVDTTLVGPLGPTSSMRATTKYRERLIDEGPP